MIKTFQGKRYSLQVKTLPYKRKFIFTLTAFHRRSKRYSNINTLNTVLGWYGAENNDPRMENSDWLLSRRKAEECTRLAHELLTDPMLLTELENDLDEDRMCGEWENRKPLSR